MKKEITTLLLLLLTTFINRVLYSAIPVSERTALIALYKSTKGNNWKFNTNWLKPGDPTQFNDPGTEGTWYGIKVRNISGIDHVAKIVLINNNLSREIPAELGTLTNLEWLWLFSNQLSGEIPPELSTLSNLYSINLSSNQLSGAIPGQLGNLSNLNSLDLSYNKLSGAIPPELGTLSNLYSIDLSSNQLSGSIPEQLGSLPLLCYLWLSSNQLTGSIPLQLSNLDRLEELDLSYNQVIKIPVELGNLSNLIYLNLSSNELDKIPPELGNLSNLKYLNLSSNELDKIPPELGNLSNLKYLNLSFNKLGKIPVELGDLSNLREFFLSSNRLNSIPIELEKLSKLQILDLASNLLKGSIPVQLGCLSNLIQLDLGGNRFSGQIPAELAQLSRLGSLRIQSNALAGDIPTDIKNLTNLVNNKSDFRWNALNTGDKSLEVFLNMKQYSGNWLDTQTVAPTNLSARGISGDAIKVSWEPIAYSNDKGGYRIYYSRIQGGPYSLFGTTEAKHNNSLSVTGLDRLTNYYFVVQTWTDAHSNNDNFLESEYSVEVSAITTDNSKVISGRVYLEKTGEGVEGVKLFFDPTKEYEVTGTDGGYFHAVLPGWSGTVIPEKFSYKFNPPEKKFNNIIEDQMNVDFKAERILQSVSGTVASAGERIPGVILTFEPFDNNANETSMTDSQGNYSHPVPYGWKGTATPSKGDLVFTPVQRDYTKGPGITGIIKGEDYELSISIGLIASRCTANTVTIKKEYGRIEVYVTLVEGFSSTEIQKFVLKRKESVSNTYTAIKEFFPGEGNNFTFSYEDKFLDTDKTYIYIIEALDAANKVIGESKERSI